MRIKIIQPGWENYTGPLGLATFVNGVAENVSPRGAAMVANVILVETDEGTNPSDSQRALDSQATPMGIPEPVSPGPAAPAAEPRPIYTREQLEQTADKRGIEGLRELAKPYGVKSSSIVKLIQAILDAQNGIKEHEKAVKLEPTPTVVAPPAPAAGMGLKDGVAE
jgi:hypothetical protein